MSTRIDWLLKRFGNTLTERDAYRKQATTYSGTIGRLSNDNERLREHVNELKAEVTDRETRIGMMAPQKQFKVSLSRKGMQDATLHIESVASSAGVTTITVRDFSA